MQNSGIFACRNIYNLILRSGRLELVGARKNGAREGDAQGERELPLPSRVFRALVFFLSPKYFQGPAKQATTIVDKIDGKSIPSSQIKDGKVACFGFNIIVDELLLNFGAKFQR